LARPGSLACIIGERQLEPITFSQTRRIGGRRYEPGAAEIEIAFARAFGWQSQAVPEFQLGLEEVASQPIDRAFAKFTGSDRFCACTRDHGTGLQDRSIVAQDL